MPTSELMAIVRGCLVGLNGQFWVTCLNSRIMGKVPPRRKERVKWNKKRGRSFYVVILRYP